MDELFNFDLPNELIAQEPVSPRDHARLLVYDRQSKTIVDDYFYNLPSYLNAHTTVVANNSRVSHCRYLFDAARMEIFAVEAVNDRTVRAMVRPGKKFKLGTVVSLGDGVSATVRAIDQDGLRTIEFNMPRDSQFLVDASHVPLPPYIAQNDTLADEYQTIYAKREGSLAAPTAGLHFTPELREVVAREFGWQEVTLDVGLGTFAPLQKENFESGTLHKESYRVSKDVWDAVHAATHVTAVGTTTLRTLESIYSVPMTSPDTFRGRASESEICGETSIFIRPGYEFVRVDSLITNFHLPSTSLLLLVEAFIGSRTELERVYRHAIDQKYRFYSFGDAMLIL